MTLALAIHSEPATAEAKITAAEARAIAKEAHIYGFRRWTTIASSTPTSSIARAGRSRRCGIRSPISARVFTPKDKAVQDA